MACGQARITLTLTVEPIIANGMVEWCARMVRNAYPKNTRQRGSRTIFCGRARNAVAGRWPAPQSEALLVRGQVLEIKHK